MSAKSYPTLPLFTLLLFHKNLFCSNKAVCTCLNMHKYITSQVSIVWYNTFIQLCSHKEIITLFKNWSKDSTARKDYTGG